MSARQATRKTLRAAIAFALTYLMLWGGVPAPALAEMAEEAMGTEPVAAPATKEGAANEKTSTLTTAEQADATTNVGSDGELGTTEAPAVPDEGGSDPAPDTKAPNDTDGELGVQSEGGSSGSEEVATTVGAATLSTQATGDNIASGTWGTCNWEIDAQGTLRVGAGEGESISALDGAPWCSKGSRIKAVVFDEGVVLPQTCHKMFTGCSKLSTLDLSGWDTSGVTDMSFMFSGCARLSSVGDLSGWDTSSVTNMGAMFSDCSSLASVDGLSGWDVSSVTNMGGMFSGCSKLASLDLSGWDTSKVTWMYGLFADCPGITSLNLSGWTTGGVTSMGRMFDGCSSLASVDGPSGWDVSSVTDMSFMFEGCSELTSLNLSRWNTSSVTSMRYMFYLCPSLSSVGDLSGWDVSKVTNMSYMFNGCSKLASLDLSGWDTSSVTDMGVMFSDCSSLASVDGPSGWDTSSVTNMGGMFSGCSKLASLDLSGWDTSKVTWMYGLFADCPGITSLNLSGWTTGGVTSMGRMFDGCSSLASVYGLSGWDVSSVTDMRAMFFGCSKLSSLDLSGWDVFSVTDMRAMFSGCSTLVRLGLIAGWDTSSVTDMGSMFYGCSSLTALDLSGWDTSDVWNMEFVFDGCSSLTALDLSGWDTLGVAYANGNANNMFSGCSSLAFVTVGDSYETHNYYEMFPESTAANGKWWSVADQGWYTKDEIVSSRSCAADTYASSEILQKTSISDASVAFEPSSVTYAGVNLEPVPTVTLGGNRLTAGTDFTCSYKNNRNVGTATVTVTGIGRYEESATGSFQIAKAPLTVRANDHGLTYGDAPSDAGVTYEGLKGTDTSESLGGSAQVASEYAQFSPAGTYQLVASGVSSDNYEITYASGTLTVFPKEVGLDWSDLTFAYDGADHCPKAAATGLVNSDSAIVTVGGAATNAGTHTATATSVSNPNYCLPASATKEFTIQKVASSVTTAPTAVSPAPTYTGGPHALVSAGTAQGGTMRYRVGDDGVWAEEPPQVTDAGTYAVYYKVEGDANHDDTADLGPVSVTVSKAAISPTVSMSGWTYGGQASQPSVSGNPGNGQVTYKYRAKSPSGAAFSTTAPTDAGDYEVQAEVAETANYQAGTATADFKISKAAISPAVTIADWTYGAEASQPSVSGNTGNGWVTYKYGKAGDSVESYTRDVPTDAGEYVVRAEIAETANCHAGVATANFTIRKAASSVTTAPAAVSPAPAYTGGLHALVSAGSAQGGAMRYRLGDAGAWTEEPPQATDAGTYAVYYKVEGDANHDDTADLGPVSVTVSKAAISPAVAIAGWTYGAEAAQPSVSANPGNGAVTYKYRAKGPSGAAFSTTVPTDAGDYEVRAEVAETANYQAGTATADFKISKAANTLQVQSPVEVAKGSVTDLSAYVNGGDGAVAYAISQTLNGCSVTSEGSFTSGATSGSCTVSVTAAGDDNHEAGTQSITVQVTEKTSLDAAEVSFQNGDGGFTYDGMAKTPGVTVTLGGNVLSPDTDYDVRYDDNVGAGTATVTVMGKGDYVGTKGKSFQISPATITSAAASPASYAYDGKAKTPTVTVKAGGLTVPASGYAVKYSNNTNAGTATVTVTGRGNFTGSNNATFRISPAAITSVSVSPTSYTYDGRAKTPGVTVKAGELTVPASGYTVKYANDTNAGTATVTVTGKGNYTGSRSVTFRINPANVSAAAMTVSPTSFTYDGRAKTPGVTVKFNGATLVSGRDFTAAFANNVNAGTATVKVTGKGNFTGSKSATFRINPAQITSVSVSPATFTYDGKAKTPGVTVKAGGLAVPAGGYTVKCANNVNAGTATVTVTGKGNFTGSKSATFRINPAAISAVSVSPTSYTYDGKAKAPGATVKAGGLTVPASGYTVKYANNVNAGTATVTVTGRGNFAGSKGATFRINPAAITSVSVSPAGFEYDGKAKTPAVVVKAGGLAVPASGYAVSYSNNTDVGTATATVTGKGNFAGSKSATFSIDAPARAGVAYQTHVQNIGDQGWRSDGAEAGTHGRAYRLEAIRIRLEGAHVPGSIEYRTHVQNIGWQDYRRDGAEAGTHGMSYRLEAIQIRLTGEMARRYDVWYCVHAQDVGDMGWAKNDAPAGTAGFARRLEAIRIVVLPKGSAAPGRMHEAFVSRDGSTPAQSFSGHAVRSRTHVQDLGWQGWATDGQMSGTQGMAKRLEGIEIALCDRPAAGSIEYRTHVQNIGWQGYVRDGQMSGTSGRALRLEAIQLRLTGAMGLTHDVWYRVHAQNFGWMGWARCIA